MIKVIDSTSLFEIVQEKAQLFSGHRLLMIQILDREFYSFGIVELIADKSGREVALLIFNHI